MSFPTELDLLFWRVLGEIEKWRTFRKGRSEQADAPLGQAAEWGQNDLGTVEHALIQNHRNSEFLTAQDIAIKSKSCNRTWRTD